MKFSPRTIQILRNFATINPSIIFNAGVELKTMSVSKTVVAKATIDTVIGKTFAIYDLSQFLAAISMFEDPELALSETSVRITSGTERMSYTFSEPSLILGPPEKQIVLPSTEISFDLKEAVLVRTMKALSVIGCPEIAVTGDGKKIHLEALDSRKPGNSSYKVEIGETSSDFQMIFKSDNILMLPADYRVSISAKGLAHFQGTDVEYFVAVEHHSKFNG
jgi:hypothetical protein